jgi:hypothetical protein
MSCKQKNYSENERNSKPFNARSIARSILTIETQKRTGVGGQRGSDKEGGTMKSESRRKPTTNKPKKEAGPLAPASEITGSGTVLRPQPNLAYKNESYK